MNEEFKALDEELQKVHRWEQEMRNSPDAEKNKTFPAIPAYVPSESVKRQNEAIVQRQKLAKNFSYGEY